MALTVSTEEILDRLVPQGKCRIWTGYCDRKNGYGQLTYKGKQYWAHRFIWELHFGLIPKGLFVLHRCDNPPCCNTDHLYLGTNQDNANDRVDRDRSSYGERHWKAKLTEAQVREIKKRLHRGDELMREIAEDFGVSRLTISNIKHGRNWWWV
jgi:HNH endonuclease